jgi:hypothetical protein
MQVSATQPTCDLETSATTQMRPGINLQPDFNFESPMLKELMEDALVCDETF